MRLAVLPVIVGWHGVALLMKISAAVIAYCY